MKIENDRRKKEREREKEREKEKKVIRSDTFSGCDADVYKVRHTIN
jgi:hypothetical protein